MSYRPPRSAAGWFPPMCVQPLTAGDLALPTLWPVEVKAEAVAAWYWRVRTWAVALVWSDGSGTAVAANTSKPKVCTAAGVLFTAGFDGATVVVSIAEAVGHESGVGRGRIRPRISVEVIMDQSIGGEYKSGAAASAEGTTPQGTLLIDEVGGGIITVPMYKKPGGGDDSTLTSLRLTPLDVWQP